MEAHAKALADLLRVLANQNRLLILCALLREPLTVGELAVHVSGISQSALSQHLALLRAHRVLDCHKSGQSITYFIADPRIGELMATLKTHYCPTE